MNVDIKHGKIVAIHANIGGPGREARVPRMQRLYREWLAERDAVRNEKTANLEPAA